MLYVGHPLSKIFSNCTGSLRTLRHGSYQYITNHAALGSRDLPDSLIIHTDAAGSRVGRAPAEYKTSWTIYLDRMDLTNSNQSFYQHAPALMGETLLFFSRVGLHSLTTLYLGQIRRYMKVLG